MSLRGRIEHAWESPDATQPKGAWVLSTLAGLYRLGITLRRTTPTWSPLPTISVGSPLVGGAGKTPLVIEICRMLRELGRAPAVLLRGYGRTGQGTMRVDPGAPDASRLYGDEACLHASRGIADVWVGADRRISAERAAAHGADVLVLDDGMQHRAIARDLEIVTVPARHPVGNGYLLPRGPLREPVAALRRADLLVLSHSDVDEERAAAEALIGRVCPGVPIAGWRGALHLRPLRGTVCSTGGDIGAFCGIGRPYQFRSGLERAGYRVNMFRAFPDHHPFRQKDMDALASDASRAGIDCLVTTEKDALRLPTTLPAPVPHWCVALLALVWTNESAREIVMAALRDALRGRR